MLDILGKLKDCLNLGKLPLLGILIFSSLFLFVPNSVLENLKILEIKNEYGSYLGLSVFFSISFLTASGLMSLWSIYLSPIIKTQINLLLYKKDGRYLTKDEKKIIKLFIYKDTRSAHLSIQDATVLGLESRKIVVRVGNIGRSGFDMTFPFNIQPWAWDFYNKNKKLLE